MPPGAKVPEGHTPPLASQTSPGQQDVGEERPGLPSLAVPLMGTRPVSQGLQPEPLALRTVLCTQQAAPVLKLLPWGLGLRRAEPSAHVGWQPVC